MAPRKDGLPKKRRKDYSPVCTKCEGERDSSNPNSPWCKACRSVFDVLATRAHQRQRYCSGVSESSGQCAICRASEEIMYLDHDHSSGSLRAFLCSRCNMGIGQFRDSSELLAKAAIYLEQHEQKKEVV